MPADSPQPSASRLKRTLYLTAGTIAILLGALGALLPILPTTPFLLLAAACYARGSQRFYDRLLANRWCGTIISNYRSGRGLPLQQKIVTLLLLWLTILATAIFMIANIWLRIMLVAIASGVTIHLLRIPTCRPLAKKRKESLLGALPADSE